MPGDIPLPHSKIEFERQNQEGYKQAKKYMSKNLKKNDWKNRISSRLVENLKCDLGIVFPVEDFLTIVNTN